jgi:hypothetical protein
MSQVVTDPDTDLAVLLLAAGYDEKALKRHAGFATLRAARDFASRSDTKAEVRRSVEVRALRVGVKGLASIEHLLDSESTDGRTRVAAARTALEVAGFLRKDSRPADPRLPHDLSAAELSVMIEETRAELAARLAKRDQTIALIPAL